MKTFPRQIIVAWEDPGNDEPYLVAHRNIADVAKVNQDVKVGIYRLIATKKVTANAELK